MELGRVVVEREHESGPLEALLGLGPDDDPPVGPLPRGRSRAVGEGATPGAAAAHQTEPIRATRGDDVLDHRADASRRGRNAASPGTFARMKLVDAVSLRSRRRKLRLFLDELRPTPATTVLDVGVDEVGFGAEGGQSGCGTHNFFEELYPWRDRITALGLHDGASFRRRYPEIAYVQGDACALPFAGPVVRRRLLERRDRARGRPRPAATVRGRGAARRPARVPDDAEPLVPDRGAHETATRPLAAARMRRPCLRPDRQELGAREPPARQRRPAELFPGPVRIVNLGLTLVAIT